MNFRGIVVSTLATMSLLLSACSGSFQGNDFASSGPASSEPPYYGKPTAIDDASAVRVTVPAKFLYRQLSFTPGSSTNGLASVVSAAQAIPIPFAEFHIYDSTGARIQQGETTTAGIADFKIPKTAGTYTLKVFSRAYNDYLKVSVLADIYANTPHSISKSFTIDSTDISAGTKDLTSTPVYAEADESVSANIEGGAFNIMFDILIANEYIRRNIGKNGATAGVPSADPNQWWVADKVTVYWKAGFNPFTYFNSTAPLSFYSSGTGKLYILGGVNGDVKTSDTDHFDDSIILHEYGHFLEDVYGHSESPGGSHTGSFIIDPRLAWSEGWANYFQAAVLTGADAYDQSQSESRMPTTKRFHYYVDTWGYRGVAGQYGVGIAFNLAEVGTNAAYDPVGTHPQKTGLFREVSIARTLYKSTRDIASTYPDATSTNKGGGVSFANIWKAFSGEDNQGYTRTSPRPYSFNNRSKYPLPNAGLFNWLLVQNGVAGAEWTSILTEEKQNTSTLDYAYYLTPTTCSATTFTNSAPEANMYSGEAITHSDLQMNNDFYLYYHNGSASTLRLDYTTTGTAMDLDLILYYGTYVYFEDAYWYAGQSSSYIAKQSRTAGTASEQISLSGLPAGFYLINIKINVYGKTSGQTGTASYTIKKDGSQLCGTEQP